MIPKNEWSDLRNLHLRSARVCREAADLKGAREHLEAALLLNPYYPLTNYELALVYHDQGDHTAAVEQLNRALALWKDAEPEYKPAENARATAQAWKAAGYAVQ